MPKRKGQDSRASKSPARSKKPAARPKAATTRNPGTEDKSLREHLLYLLRGGGAHLDFEKAIAGLPAELRGTKPVGLPFSAWGLLEHMRLAQWDILEFSRNPQHVSPPWPEGYWPSSDAPPSAAAWERSVAAFRANCKAMEQLVASSKADLHAKIPHGDGQTILREALLVADHNAYHLGQLVMLRRLLGAWPD
jgi:DinB superfamily